MDRNPFTTTPASAPSGTGKPNQPDPALPTVSIPDHQLLRCIGRGSYGEVWLARNMMGVYRAVKIVYRKSFDTQRPFDRELSGIQKFEPISRSHEGFVDVLQVGIKPDEYFYYVMELGDDQNSGQDIQPENYSPKTLAKGISLHGKLPFDECLQLGLALSQALAELHKHKLVHRDVKPSNIIFVNGVPKLADIGLVAETAVARSYVGTEGFIPPEGPGAPNADVYGLGKVLYECSTGKDRHEFPELPTLLDEFPEHEKFLELNEIILHACKAEAKDRYQSAWDMHSNLLVLANGKSVKRLKFLERRLAAAKRIAGLSVAILLLGGFVLVEIYRERHAFLEALQRQVGANVAYGNNAMESGDSLGALPYFADAIYLDKNTAKQNEDRLRFASTLAQCPALVQMWFFTNLVFGASYHPEGRHVVIAEYKGRAQIFDIQTGAATSPPFGFHTDLRGASFSPDGTLVLTASEGRAARVWRAADGVELFRLNHPDSVFSASFSPDGQHIITGCGDGVVRIWNSGSRELEQSLKGHTAAVAMAAYSHNGQMIVTAGRDNTVRLWNALDGRPIGPALEHPTWVNCAAFSPDDREIATGCFDHKVRVWDVASQKQLLPDMRHDDGISTVEFSPDGRLLLSAGLDRTVRLWSTADHLPVENNPIIRHGDRVICAAFAANGHEIMTTGADGTVHLWDLAGAQVASAPFRQVFSEDGNRYVTVSERGIQTWDAASNQPVSPFFNSSFPSPEVKPSADGNFVMAVRHQEQPDGVRKSVEIFEAATGRQSAAPFFIPDKFARFLLSRDGRRLLAIGKEEAQTWDPKAGAALTPLMSLHGVGLSGLLSPDGNKVALWNGNTVELRDAITGQALFPALPHAVAVQRVQFSSDGSRLLTYCLDSLLTKCSAQVWDTTTGQAVGVPMTQNDGIVFACFSPDATKVVTACEDYTAVVWNAKTGLQLSPTLKHKEKVLAVGFSPDGKKVATASADRTARIWNAETGEPLGPPLRHITAVNKVKFLADGRHLLTGRAKGDFWLWPLPENQGLVEDLRKQSRLLSSGSVMPAGASTLFQAGSLEPLWQEFRTNHPAQTIVATSQIAAWHEFEAEKSEIEKQWSAAVFHSRQILALRPNDNRAAERLECAQKHLAEKGVANADTPRN